ncbi:Leucine-rich repeat, cysteine-containing subtype [Corchorus olitorius]|uniref:Leucine-rich repeat, cysteine-containing subtype n=1 Tax=Corchorus olitorius TaxID=93759 RepID=A0A1R3HDH5_9ROSI|nr:Leucine-rich repeat, cysteine-containing subtype [Corchorus olitorius]
MSCSCNFQGIIVKVVYSKYSGRASQLRCLQLACCYAISDEGLSEVASKLPLLEELEIYVGNTGKHAIEAVGSCCPLLKTLKYNQEGIRNTSFRYDKEALAIAQNMPGLHHLQLIGNHLTNHGLQAILDGCPHLESLDLRECFHVNLEGDLGKRCAQ